MRYEGLQHNPGGPCRNEYEVHDHATGRVTCTHGPDPAPPGVDVTTKQPEVDAASAPSALAAAPPAPSTGFSCYDGNGSGGVRVQLLYVYAADKPNRYATYASSFQTWAASIDAMVNASAQETSGIRHVRLLTDTACKPIVNTVQVSSTGDDTFDNTVSELRQKGYNLDSRKYMAWVDANVYCGLGEKWIDDARTTSTYRNLNDGAAGTHGTFARVDTGCWNYAESHEVMHTLGSVQESAPHATTHGHCWDEYDRMCYDDDSTDDGIVDTTTGTHAITYACADAAHENRFDCNHDDYFHTAPPANSYLATHWDSALNSFLATTGLPDPPTSLLLDPRSGAITASWKAPKSNGGSAVTAYVVGLYDGSTLAQPVYTTPDATTLTKTFTGLTNGKTYTVQVQARTAIGNSLPASGTATPQNLGVTFAPPTTLGSPLVATFTESVQNVTAANFQVTQEGKTTPLAAPPSCKTIQGTAVSCATGPAKTAQITPGLVTGEHYTVTVDPPGAAAVTATAGGATVPTTTSPVFRVLSAEETKSTQLWAVVSDAGAKGGSYMVERAATAYATLGFSGTGITWFTMTGPDQGTADVYVDNVLKLSAVNNYSATKTFGVARTITGLTAASHSLKVVVKGVKGTAAATDTRVVLDAVQVEGATEIVTPAFSRVWRSVSLATASGGKYIVDDVAGASDYVKFRGTGVTVWFVRSPDAGRVTPVVDSTTYTAIDLYSSTTGLYGLTFTGLSDAVHTIKLNVAGTKQAASTGTKVAVDRYVAS